jgi:hypothetical protein
MGIFGFQFCPEENHPELGCAGGFGTRLLQKGFGATVCGGPFIVCWFGTARLEVCEPCPEPSGGGPGPGGPGPGPGPGPGGPGPGPQPGPGGMGGGMMGMGPAVATRLVVTTDKDSYKAGETIYVNVKTYRGKKFFNRYNGVLAIHANDDTGVYPLTVMITNGIGNFTATFCKPGLSHRIKVGDGVLIGKTDKFRIIPGDVVGFDVQYLRPPDEPATIEACKILTITVCAKDGCGNIVKNFVGLVNFSSTDLNATLPIPINFKKGFQGCSQRTMTFTTVGSQILTATSADNPTLTGTMPMLVVHNVIRKFIVKRVGGQVCISASDRCGNTITEYVGTAVITTTVSGIPSSYTFMVSDFGTKCFTTPSNGNVLAIDNINCEIRGSGIV